MTTTPTTTDIGRALRFRRIALGWTQREAAAKLRITGIYLCYMETGKHHPSPAMLADIEAVYGINVYVAAWCKRNHRVLRKAKATP